MGANLRYEGIKEAVERIGPKVKRKVVEPTPQEINSEWKRLASFMQGQK